MKAKQIAALELQNAFNWSCKMTEGEFYRLARILRMRHELRFDPHENRQLPISFQATKDILHLTWRKFKNAHSDPTPDFEDAAAPVVRAELFKIWDSVSTRFKEDERRLGTATDIYDAILKNPVPEYKRILLPFTLRTQIAHVSVYLQRTIDFQLPASYAALDLG